MAMIRRICKAFLIVSWMMIIWVALALANIGSYWQAQRNLAKVARVWGKGLAWIFGIKIKIIGDANHFEGGLVISNHTGYIDILVHAAVFPIRFAAKSSIRRWPFLGWFIATGRPIWIDRLSPSKSKIAAKKFTDSMDNGVLLLVYPEGTSTSGRDGMLEFKSTPFASAVAGNNWILPTIVSYEETPDSESIAWYGDMIFLPHLWRILGYKRINAEIKIMEAFKPEGRKRKELALFAHDEMEKEYIKILKSKEK